MRQLIAGNWKMNATTREAAALVGALAAADAPACDVLVCPPATQLMMAAHALLGTSIAVGAQDCHAEGCGAHTGDIAASMLRDAGATWVIVGHSERRAEHGESDADVRAKAAAAAQAGLTPIVCVGETQAQRAGGHQTDIIGRQLAGSLPDGFGDEFGGVVAYEPIWAIGTGQSATEADVEAMHAFIHAQLVQRFPAMGGGMRVLYGGSVKPSNAASLLALPDVGGALVGGASLVAADFLAIARAARAI